MKSLILILLCTSMAYSGAKVRSGGEQGGTAFNGSGSNCPEGCVHQYFGHSGFSDGRTGNARLHFIANGNPSLQQASFSNLTLTAPVYASFWMFLDNNNLPNANSHIVLISNASVTNYLGLVWTTTGTMSLTVDGVVKATTAGFVTRGSFILVKMSSRWTTVGNLNTVVINGETLTDTTAMGAVAPSILGFGWFSAQVNPFKFVDFDDIKLNDASGSYENSAPDDSSGIYFLPVSADSSIGNWTGGAGGTTNLYQNLWNTPADGRDTSTETDGTQIKNLNAAANNSFIGKIQKVNDYVDNQTRTISSSKTIRVAQLVVRHAQHRDVVTIDGSAQLLSNPTDPSATTFIYGDSSSQHGIDVHDATGDASLEWRTKFGDPIYFPTINRSLNTVFTLTKVTSTVHPAEFDQAGLLLEVGQAQSNSFKIRVIDW